VLNADGVALAKCLPIRAAVPMVYVGVLVFIAIIDIGAAMIFIILAGTLNAVMEAATLNLLLVLRWRGFP
jgi:hypothetical protein